MQELTEEQRRKIQQAHEERLNEMLTGLDNEYPEPTIGYTGQMRSQAADLHAAFMAGRMSEAEYNDAIKSLGKYL